MDAFMSLKLWVNKMDCYSELEQLLKPEGRPLIVVSDDPRDPVRARIRELGYDDEFDQLFDSAVSTADHIESFLELVRDDRDHDESDHPQYEPMGVIRPSIEGYDLTGGPFSRSYRELYPEG